VKKEMTRMTAKEDLKKALSRLPPRPWRADIVPPSTYQQRGFTLRPGDDDIGPQAGFDVGAIRSVPTGANVVEPWPESASMVITLPGGLQALVDAINAAEELAKDE
jgi:hypothetical protein